MKKNIFLSSATLILLQLISCKNETVLPPSRTDIHFDSTALLGKYLVDKDGKTLYYFSNDVNGQSNCSGGCLSTWPIYYTDSASTTYSNGLSAADFKTMILPSGTKQTTYKGWPLYYYAPAGVPELAGEVKGEGVGNVWFVAKTNYSIMIANHQLTGSNGINYLQDYTPGDGRTNYFTDDKGNTLYSFTRDSAFINKFTRPDFSNNAVWPIYETDNITVPSTLDKSLFVIMTFNGKKQLTYKGWPLYYYGPDNFARGINKGITIPPTLPAGAVWPVMVKDVLAAPRL